MKKLYVGNLPFNASEEQLQEWFGQLGISPSAISLIRDRFTGQSRGFAFIEIANDEDADRAVTSLNGQNFGGRNLVVNEARPQTERSGGGGGRGGYGGGRGGDRGGRGGGGGRAAIVAIAETVAIAGSATLLYLPFNRSCFE